MSGCDERVMKLPNRVFLRRGQIMNALGLSKLQFNKLVRTKVLRPDYRFGIRAVFVRAEVEDWLRRDGCGKLDENMGHR